MVDSFSCKEIARGLLGSTSIIESEERMQLWKAHGLGNDYLVWEGSANTLHARDVQKICHRTQGIGGDGILEPVQSQKSDFGVRIWNPDGSIAEKSGNGLRIFAHWLHYEKGAPSSFSIDTGFCVVQAHILAAEIAIEMGIAYWNPADIPCTRPFGFNNAVIFNNTRARIISSGTSALVNI